MSNSIFLRLLRDEDKASLLMHLVEVLREGRAPSGGIFPAKAEDFGSVPGSPFAYWVGDSTRALFRRLPRLESAGRVARITNGTMDDFRWIRATWEIHPARVGRTRGWVPHAKGGAFSPYHADLHLLLGWDDVESTFSGYTGTLHRPDLRPASLDYFFRPGLTWSRRSQRGFSVRVLPSHCIFADKGPAVFVEADGSNSLLALLAVMNSNSFGILLNLQMAFGSYEVGVIQRTPIPALAPHHEATLAGLGAEAYRLVHSQDLEDETAHAFTAPTLALEESSTLQQAHGWREERRHDSRTLLQRVQEEINREVSRLYGLSEGDLELDTLGKTALSIEENVEQVESDAGGQADRSEDDEEQVADLLSWCVGCVLGRWDVRIGLQSSLAPRLQGPFDPLPVCSPGMLIGTDGLPARSGGIVSVAWLRARPNVISLPPVGSVGQPTIPDADHPLRIDWNGILVDDEGHPDDVVGRVRDVLTLLWGERADAIEHEACEIISVRVLREWFRNPKRFWDFHVKRYSKSRRKAPIYWLLQSSRRGYGMWLYYHHMDADTLFKALRYVNDRLALERARLEEALAERTAAGDADARTRRAAEKRVEAHEAFLSEVTAFRDELARVADLGLVVDHDDGVLLSIAPLHTLVPWAPARTAWNELVQGKYDWSGIGQQMRAKGLVKGGGRG